MKKRPNIIFLLSDDQGEWAMGCSGNKEIITPNLDRLAAEGMLFLRFPSLFTGEGQFINRKNSVPAWSS